MLFLLVVLVGLVGLAAVLSIIAVFGGAAIVLVAAYRAVRWAWAYEGSAGARR